MIGDASGGFRVARRALAAGALCWVVSVGFASDSETLLRGHSDIAFGVSRRGNRVVLAGAGDGLRDLYLLRLDTLRVTRVAKTPDYERDPAFAPDGKSVVYAASPTVWRPAHICVRAPAGGQRRQLTHGDEFYDLAPSFSADGSRIVFARAHLRRPYSMGGYTWDKWDIYVMNADGTALRRVTHEEYRSLSSPKFSPSGKVILFSAYRGASNDQVFAVESDGGQPVKTLTPETGGASANATLGSQPDISPDGKRIVFISDRAKGFEYDLYLMNADGTNVVRVTRNKAHNERPVFAPDGQGILFLSDPFLSDAPFERFVHYGLWYVDGDGKNLRQIADRTLFDAPLRWKP